MRTLIVLCLLLPLLAHAQSLTVNCTPSFTNTDGTTIPIGTPMTFNLYKPGQAMPLAAGYTSCSFKRTNLTPGATYVHYVTEVVGDKESDPSEMITTQLAPVDPVCASAPPNETRSQACPAPTTGTFEQSHGWTSVAAPACWSADAWVPAAPPAGVCVTPPAALVTTGTYSYCATGTASAPTMTAIGYAAAGLSCGPATRQIGAVKYCQITKAQTDIVGWCSADKSLAAGIWARAAP